MLDDTPLLGSDAIGVLLDGTLSEPRLDHPECVAVDAEGGIWCGGERGQVFRLAPDGSSLEGDRLLLAASRSGSRSRRTATSSCAT